MGTICDYLAYDHQRCDDLFARVESNVTVYQWQQAGENFRLFDVALDRHLRMEETVIFPAFEKTIRGSGAPLAMLRIEHQRIRAILERILDALRRADPAAFILHTETFALLMQQHSVKEEDMLYPLLDRILGSRAAAVVDAMRERFDAAIH